MRGVRKRGILIILCCVFVDVEMMDVAGVAAAEFSGATVTAPEQLVHAYPLGSERLCCHGPSGTRPTIKSASSPSGPPPPARSAVVHTGGAGWPAVIWVALGAAGALLLTAMTLGRSRQQARPQALLGALGLGPRTAGRYRRRWRGDHFKGSSHNPRIQDEARAQRANVGGSPDERKDVAGPKDIAGAEDADLGGNELHAAIGASNHSELAAADAAYGRSDQGGDADGAFNLGILLEAQGDLAGAQAAYGRADQRGHADAATNLGVLLERQGDRPGAEAAYRRADQRGDACGAYNLGVLLEEQNDPAGAKTAYLHAEQLGHPEAARMARAALPDLDARHPRSQRRSRGRWPPWCVGLAWCIGLAWRLGRTRRGDDRNRTKSGF